MLSRVVSVASRVRSSDSSSEAFRFLGRAETDDEASRVLDVAVSALSGVVFSDNNSPALRFLDLEGVLNGSG